MPGVPVLLGPVSMGLGAKSGVDGCCEQPAAPWPSLASWPRGDRGWLAARPLFLPIFPRCGDGGSKRTAWGLMAPMGAWLPAPPASCTGPLL